ncbi:hypothetical protein ACG94V_07010 [Acinetobacter sp. ULE_I001]|uniref:hypothetical protein n=1 Tax=unclassified Acinetobacter TaxID=196816 RepID=UPI003AF96CFA
MYYHTHVTGGKIRSSSGEEDFCIAESVEDLIDQLPSTASELNYSVYKLEEYVLGVSSEYALKALLLRLPNIDIYDVNDFKVEVIKLISMLNP